MPYRSFVILFIACLTPVLEAQSTPPAELPPLPGKGMAQHPFLYCGEWQNRSTSQQVMHIVQDGKIVWSYTNPLKGELGDCSMQNGNPAKLMVINKVTNKVEKEMVLPTRNATGTHGQFRHIRMTPAGTFLVAHLDLGKVVEYDQEGKELWSVPAPSVWAAVRLKNGNTLLSGNQHGYVREVNPKGETVWEINKDDLPGITLFVQEVSRLANGNTLINNWVGSAPTADWPKIVQLIEVTPDKKVVWALRDWTTLGPASSTQLLDEPGVAEKRELQR